MQWSSHLVTAASLLGLTCVFAAPPRAIAAAPIPSSTEQLVSSVLTLKQIGRLGLTQGQLRDIVQRLSTLSHAQNAFAAHQVDAARPVLEQLHRIKAALQAGNTPDAADQTAVDRALAGLRPEQIHVEQMRSETISAIRQILTADQMTTLRGFLGIEARPDNGADPYALYFGNYQPQLRRRFKLMRPPGGHTPAAPPVDLPAVPRPGAETPADLNAVLPQLLEVEANQPRGLADAPQDLEQLATATRVAVTVQRDLVQALDAAAPAVDTSLLNGALVPAPTTATAPEAGPNQPGNNGLDRRMAELEDRMARIQQLLEKLMGANAAPIQMTMPVITAPQVLGGKFGQYTMQPQTQRFINGAIASAVGGGPSDDDVVARFFLQPEILNDLRSLAAR
ncbi:MAG: hypothetical protein LC772_05440 [Chloroflexi bacterium]|nr:hypothetical protein [Chloroflexota bacterium]